MRDTGGGPSGRPPGPAVNVIHGSDGRSPTPRFDQSHAAGTAARTAANSASPSCGSAERRSGSVLHFSVWPDSRSPAAVRESP